MNPQNYKPKDQQQKEQHKTDSSQIAGNKASQQNLNAAQQQFVLKFCRQLASVIQACEQSESAEIEIGRRQVGSQQVRVKLQAKRQLSNHQTTAAAKG